MAGGDVMEYDDNWLDVDCVGLLCGGLTDDDDGDEFCTNRRRFTCKFKRFFILSGDVWLSVIELNALFDKFILSITILFMFVFNQTNIT